jgi:hypothetical protein
MSTLDDWLVQTSRSLDINADTIPADLRNELLDLTRDVAHGVARIAGPLTCYLVGVAVGRGQSPSAALAAVTALLPPDGATPDGAVPDGMAPDRANKEGRSA